ncbi:uncharacterized protein LOC144863645 [Branchiostoma floridae x Branchiostoma japonicum]
MDKLIAQAKEMGLEGPAILKFVEEQQAHEREERAREREAKKEAEEAQRRHELEMETLKLKQAQYDYHANEAKEGAGDAVKAKAPRLPSFVEGERIDAYLLRFERFARAHQWAENTWASSLSALLSGNALDVYGRLSDEEAKDYKKVKEAILKRYELTEDGFRLGEAPDQYIVRLSHYLDRWIELSDVPKTYDGIRDLIVH